MTYTVSPSHLAFSAPNSRTLIVPPEDSTIVVPCEDDTVFVEGPRQPRRVINPAAMNILTLGGIALRLNSQDLTLGA